MAKKQKRSGSLLIPGGLGLTVVHSGGKADIWLKKPMECKRCHRMVMILLNRMGATYCMTCVPEEPR